MNGKFYGADRFKPRLILTQMIVMQTSFALCFSTFAACADSLIGAPLSLSQLFTAEAYTWETSPGLALACSLWATSLVMAYSLRFVVERAKKCLDFVFTYHFFHFVATCYLTGFPSTFHWWVINAVALLVAVLLGEYACMLSETKAIALGSKGGAKTKAKREPPVVDFQEI
mmetsp:Transcript_98640/g.283430  ORF Transcript_98640/g.283430 Transcript_98640/m.283430 type:complete len:171 (+) Transcript_98640:80-592(+)